MLLAALMLVQTAPCAAMDASLPAPLAAWATPGHGDPNDLTRPVTFVSLKPADLDKIRQNPRKVVTIADAVQAIEASPREPAETGGTNEVGFRVDKAGVYGIALDQSGWIDVTPEGGAPLVSVQHGHGPECSTIRKIVRFDLQPGAYRLTLTKLTRPQAKVMLIKD